MALKTRSPMRTAAISRLQASRGHLDWRAQRADARTALCIAIGAAIDDIDPAAGYHVSWSAYMRAHDSWVRALREDSGDGMRRKCREVAGFWAQLRPEFVQRLPWPTHDITCDTCSAPESAWDVTHRLHVEGSGQCPLCREADIEDDANCKQRTDL